MRHYVYSLERDGPDRKESSPPDQAIQRELSDYIRESIILLESPTREVIEFYYTDRSPAISVSDLALRLEMSRQSVRRHHDKGLRELKRNPSLCELS